MVKVIFTKTHCFALCDRGHIIAGEALKDFHNTRLYDMVLDNQAGRETKLDGLSKNCDGHGHNTEVLEG